MTLYAIRSCDVMVMKPNPVPVPMELRLWCIKWWACCSVVTIAVATNKYAKSHFHIALNFSTVAMFRHQQGFESEILHLSPTLTKLKSRNIIKYFMDVGLEILINPLWNSDSTTLSRVFIESISIPTLILFVTRSHGISTDDVIVAYGKCTRETLRFGIVAHNFSWIRIDLRQISMNP